VWQKFAERHQRAHESVQAFSAIKKTLWGQAYPEAQDQELLIESFMAGLINTQVRRGMGLLGLFRH